MLTREEIIHIAKLAKLNLTDDEIPRFRKQLSSILDYISKLNEVNTDSVEPVYQSISELKNRFHEEGMDSSLEISEVVKNAKQKSGRYIQTEAVL